MTTKTNLEVMRLAAALPADDRLLLRLTFVSQIPVRTLAKVFDKPQPTLRARINRLCCQLRASLDVGGWRRE